MVEGQISFFSSCNNINLWNQSFSYGFCIAGNQYDSA
jgi:hypothetical protein